VQEALLEQLRLQLQNEAFKEEVKGDLKDRVERLREIEAELKQQLDETLDIEKFRMDLESGQALSNAMDQFNQLEEEIQKFKEKMKAEQDEFSSWEKESTAARNKGLFFKSLYKPDADTDSEETEGSSGSSSSRRSRAPADPEEAQKLIAASAAVTNSAEEEVGSPFRMYLFTYMAAVLFIVAVQDVFSQEPSLALDGLYGVLGLLLGVNAWNEKAALTAAVEDRHQKIQAAATSQKQQQQQEASVQRSSSENSGAAYDD